MDRRKKWRNEKESHQKEEVIKGILWDPVGITIFSHEDLNTNLSRPSSKHLTISVKIISGHNFYHSIALNFPMTV